MARVRAIWAGMAVCFCHLAHAQNQPNIRTTVPLVVVPVSVQDRAGHFVYGLSERDFVLLDEGQPRTVHLETADTISAPFENDLIRLGTDVHSRYILSFEPGSTTVDTFHRIRIEVRDRPDLQVAGRPGYWAVSE